MSFSNQQIAADGTVSWFGPFDELERAAAAADRFVDLGGTNSKVYPGQLFSAGTDGKPPVYRTTPLQLKPRRNSRPSGLASGEIARALPLAA